MNVHNLITNNIDDNNHYLYQALINDDRYYKNFLAVSKAFSKHLPPKVFANLLKEKLQIRNGAFDRKQFIQFACETTVVSYFANKYSDKFKYELNVNPCNNSNVECQYAYGACTFNIEVKCPCFDAKEKNDNQDALKLFTAGRIPDMEVVRELSELLRIGQINKSDIPKNVIVAKNMDNTLKDFLVSAQNKFNPNSSENELNILVVCCANASDMQNWHGYMFGNQGLFRDDSFHSPSEYDLVDIVVLTNLYHRHLNWLEKTYLENIWNFENAFNLAFVNRKRKLDKNNAISSFLKSFPHYGFELSDYKPLGDAPDYIKDKTRILEFIYEKLTKKGINLF